MQDAGWMLRPEASMRLGEVLAHNGIASISLALDNKADFVYLYHLPLQAPFLTLHSSESRYNELRQLFFLKN